MIFGVFVDLPYVIDAFAGKNVPRRQHSGHHGVILIVVFVHSVSANKMQAWIALLQLAPDHRQMVAIGVVIDGVGFGLTHHAAADHVGARNQADLDDLARGRAR